MFHIKIKNLRERRGLSREETANSLNISYQTLAKYENGQRRPDVQTLVNIAAFFEVTVDYLLDSPTIENGTINDVVIYFHIIKEIVRDSEDLYFGKYPLSDTSKTFIYECLEFIESQIVNFEEDDTE